MSRCLWLNCWITRTLDISRLCCNSNSQGPGDDLKLPTPSDFLPHPDANDLSCWSAVKHQFSLCLSLFSKSQLPWRPCKAYGRDIGTCSQYSCPMLRRPDVGTDYISERRWARSRCPGKRFCASISNRAWVIWMTMTCSRRTASNQKLKVLKSQQKNMITHRHKSLAKVGWYKYFHMKTPSY